MDTEAQLHWHPLVFAAFAELTAIMSSSNVDRGRGQAPLVLIVLVAALEAVVLDDDHQACCQLWAWTRLWASLRFDDLKWAKPQCVILTDRGLEGGRTADEGCSR